MVAEAAVVDRHKVLAFAIPFTVLLVLRFWLIIINNCSCLLFVYYYCVFICFHTSQY